MSSEQLLIYKNSLEKEIENKNYFIKQAQNAIDKLTSENMEIVEDEEVWNDFLKKPMFFPDRSDPIGISLVSVDQRQRLESSKEYIEKESLNQLEEMVTFQRSLNHDLELFHSILLKRLNKSELGTEIKQETAHQRNAKLKRILKTLIEDYIAVDLTDSTDSIPDAAEKTLMIVDQLLKGDTLNLNVFEGHYSALYRLLLRSGIIERVEPSDGISIDDVYIKLVEFTQRF